MVESFLHFAEEKTEVRIELLKPRRRQSDLHKVCLVLLIPPLRFKVLSSGLFSYKP